MRINTRFPVAVHILTLLAFSSEYVYTSDLIARSVNTNPVVIRRILALLKQANLVEVHRGVGGASLKRPPQDICLLDIYNAVKDAKKEELFDIHPNPSNKCFVGANIHAALSNPLREAQRDLERKLSEYTLKDIIRPITKKTGRKEKNSPFVSMEPVPAVNIS